MLSGSIFLGGWGGAIMNKTDQFLVVDKDFNNDPHFNLSRRFDKQSHEIMG